MSPKRTQKKAAAPKKNTAEKNLVLQKIWQPIEKFFLAVYELIKTLLKSLLILVEKILRFTVDIIMAIAKVIQAVGIAFLAVATSAFLVVLAGYFLSKAVDLPNSKNFQVFREEVWDILIEAAEPDFAAWRNDAQAWIDYRDDLQKLYQSNFSYQEKVEKLDELRADFYRKLDEGDPNGLELRIFQGN